MDLKTFLRQPYPFPGNVAKTALIIGVGIGLLMLFLRPFGLSNVSVKDYHLFLAGYGLVSFLVLLFTGLLVINLFSDIKWNIIRQIAWSSSSVFCLGVANYVYTFVQIDDFPFSISALLILQAYTFFIAIIPITILVLVRQNRLLRMNRNTAKVLNDNLLPIAVSKDFPDDVVLTAENGKTQLNIKINDLAFIESEGNYIQIYIRKNDSIVVRTIRSSIVKAETELTKHPQMMKCHRAFIVNKDFIEYIKGNAQGYRLGIKGANKEVYVSRQYTKLIKEAINKV